MKLRKALLATTLLFAFNTSIHAASNDLPALGDAASSIVSLQEEYELGRAWLRQLHAHARTIDDPLSIEFIENLVFRMIPHSGAPQQDFDFVIIDKKELNAFAVPGGVIGINLGLLLYTRDEDEIAAVLAHELAHLSQRHFARQVERAEQQQPMAIATLLASILLIATNNADAGFAGLMASQAASIQSQLAYSRDWEREADRIGINTLAESGFDPQAMPSMFNQMMAAGRLGKKPPEFLLTHPLTLNRVSDAAARAEGYSSQPRHLSFDFAILKNRARIRYQLSDKQVAATFTPEAEATDNSSLTRNAARYSLAEYALQHQDNATALQQLNQLDASYQQSPAALALLAKTLTATNQAPKALEMLTLALTYHPGSYLLISTRANVLAALGRAEEAVNSLRPLTEQRPTTPALWFQLSQLAAQASHTVLTYQASAEYWYLNGDYTKASRQMDLAIAEAAKKKDFQRQEALKERLKGMAASQKQLG
ncbi:M48 family metalloprotease [Oceanobacter sp. 5_MG-2023]|uniref:M48 family metalloprotease n=1 Tax=Oceanobacter sp. 5_MG-2023 TaxID=3062645 RepID=UPI0026E3CFA8|nr:M48 family metalloprotease [Oceanobacter sp. 5_MG-2023]MDO6682779.1 M48 family metalloprotease [Oceanobacter sp. 5_MG-2023]